MRVRGAGLRGRLVVIGVVAILASIGLMTLTGAPAVMQPAQAQERVPGNALGSTSDSDFWRAARRGDSFTVSIPDKQAGVLIQSEGDNWRAVRNGPLSTYGGYALVGIIVLLGVFLVLRGRIRVDSGLSGRTVERFNGIERFAHWLTAICFVILAVTGLDLLYGRYMFGADPTANSGDFDALHKAFAAVTYYGKLVHNYVAFAFMAGLVITFAVWVRHNIVDRYDFNWVIKGGGMFVKGVHPPARKFNFGQKAIFWIVVLGGLLLALTGISLMFPFEFAFFAKSFAFLNIFGVGLPTDITALEEMQLSQILHSIVALGMIVVIIAHIYIGSLGMEGAFWAMGNGQVDENWAREHHSVWAAELGGTPRPEAKPEGGDD